MSWFIGGTGRMDSDFTTAGAHCFIAAILLWCCLSSPYCVISYYQPISIILVLEEQSLKESPLPKTISPEEELKILRRKTQERHHAPPASVAITQLLLKKPFSLHCFRAIHEKEALLDEAIACGDGDAILTVNLSIVYCIAWVSSAVWCIN